MSNQILSAFANSTPGSPSSIFLTPTNQSLSLLDTIDNNTLAWTLFIFFLMFIGDNFGRQSVYGAEKMREVEQVQSGERWFMGVDREMQQQRRSQEQMRQKQQKTEKREMGWWDGLVMGASLMLHV